MMKNNLFLSIYAEFSKVSPGQTARSRALAGVESRRGATAVGRRESLLPAAFAIMPVPQSPPWPRFLSPLSEPAVRFPRSGLSSGTMPLAHGSIRQRRGMAQRRFRRPQSPAPARSHGRSPSLSHAVVPALPNSNRGFQARPLPESFALSLTRPHLRPLPSTGVSRILRYYGPLRHPDGPGRSSRIPG